MFSFSFGRGHILVFKKSFCRNSRTSAPHNPHPFPTSLFAYYLELSICTKLGLPELVAVENRAGTRRFGFRDTNKWFPNYIGLENAQ